MDQVGEGVTHLQVPLTQHLVPQVHCVLPVVRRLAEVVDGRHVAPVHQRVRIREFPLLLLLGDPAEDVAPPHLIVVGSGARHVLEVEPLSHGLRELGLPDSDVACFDV